MRSSSNRLGIEASAAQDAVTAIIKAFGKNVNEIEDVMDKLVLVGNNFPISVSQLAEGMNNAGSMLAVAGNSFEQSIALLTAANTTIQNISKASTGLRTIAARIRKTTTGEDDGEIVEEAKYQEMVNALTKQHVSLVDEVTGQYRSTYDIIRDIAGVWKDMTSMEQAAVVEALAGTRQQNIFASLMTQFGEAEDAMERMNNSAGELQESYDIYLGSIQAHVQTLKAAFDELSRDFVNSGFAKGALDILTKFVEGLDAIISHLGVLGTALTAIGSLGIIRSISAGSFAAGFGSLAKAIGLTSTAISSIVATAPAVALFVGTITALVLIAKKFNEEYQKAHPTTEQLASDFQKAKGEADRLAKQIEVNTKRLEELNEIRGTEEWTKELEAERAGLEEQNLKLKEQLGLLEDIAKYKQEAYNGRLNGDIDKYFNTGREVYNPVGLEGNNGGELYTHKATEGYGYLWNSVDEYKKALEELEELEERRRNHDWSSEKEAEQLNQDIINKNLDVANYAQRIEDERARLIAWRDSLAESTDEESLRNIGKINVALDKISKETGKNVKSFDDFKSKIKSLSDDALKYLTGESKNAEKAQKELSTWLKKSGYSANEAAQYFVQYAKELKESASAGEQAAKSTIADLAGVADEGDRALQVWEKYQKAMEAGERDDLLKNYQQAWQDAIDDIENNRIDSQKVHAAIDLFIPRETQRALGNNMRKMGEYLSSDFFRAIWESSDEDERTVAQKAFEYIRDNLTREDGVWVSGNNLSYESIEKFAAALKIPVEAATTVLKQLDIYGVGVYNSIQDNAALIDSFVALKNTLGSTEKAIDQTVRELAERYDRLDIHQILGDLQEKGVIDIDTTTLHQKIDEVYDTIDQTDEESAEPDVILNIDSVIENAENVTTILKALDGYTAHTFITSEYLPPAGDPTTVNSNGFSGTSGKIGTSSSTGPSGHSTSTHAGAHGKSRGEGGGDTLVNELGPELISDQGKAFIANGGKPGFVKLSADAIVFTAEETKDILRGKRNVNGKALAQGSVGRGSLIGKLFRGRVKARAYKVCGNCGATLSATASRCPNCGSFVLITKQDYGASNAGVNRSAYGSPTASNTQNMGGNGYYYNPSNGNTYYARPNGNGTSTIITYTTTTSESSIAQAQQAEEYAYIASITAQLKRDTEQLKAENAALRAKAEGKGNESIFGNGQKNQSLGSGLAGSGGGNYVGGADYRSYAESQKVDWVAVRINRLQRTIADLEKIASSGFKKLDKRLEAARDQISKTTDEIKVMDQAYNRYIQEANSVGLSDSIASLVRNGSIDITKYDDDTRKKIDEYTEWYEKALDAQSAVEELHQNIAQIYVDSFDMVQTDFENQLAQIEHDATMTSKNLEMAQTKGYLDSATFYEQLVSNQADQVNRLNMELTELNQKFKEAMDSGEIEENSEAWYTMKQSINEVEEAIADANIQLVQYQRTIRQLDWSYFDYAQERFSQMTAEAQFFVDLMSNHELFQDNGQFNNLGEATAGMHAVNYDVYMAQADEYAKQIQKIQRDLESDPYDTELIERREQLLELQRQSILSAEGEKNAVKDLVQNGINLELQALKDLIDAYNDSLDSAKDLYEYQKSITEKTADIASIQKQLSAYQNDASEETRARVQKLTQNLEKAQTELRETEWDRSISDQKKLLDDMYDEYEDYLNQRLDNIDLLMQEMITGTNINMDSIRNTLIDVGEEVGYTMTDQMTQALSADLNYYEHMSGEINSVQVVLSNIYDMVAAMARASGAVKAYATGGLVDYTGLAAVHGSKGKPELMLNASDTANFLEAAKMMREMAGSSISIPSTSGFGNGGGMTIGQLHVNIPIDRVLDYNDLISQLRDDPKFERLVNAMTLDRAVGKSAFGKNKIVF